MDKLIAFRSFLKENGRRLSEINPGSDEIGLTVDDCIKAITLLQDSQKAIVGADVLTENNGKLIYAYQCWGREYIYLDWYCQRMPHETDQEFADRSYELAKEKIRIASEVAGKLKGKCFIVLVLKL